jgi:hypothetical protein
MDHTTDKAGPGSAEAHPKALLGDDEKADGAVDDLAPALRPKTEVPDEVKAVVAAVDDPGTPCETVRAYFLGVVFAAVGTALNTWFGSRQPGGFTCTVQSGHPDRQVSTFLHSSRNSSHTPSVSPWRTSFLAATSPSSVSASP